MCRFDLQKVLIICCAVLQTVFAGTTGKLTGAITIKDTGEPLVGANILIEGTGLGAATDLGGNYFILQVPPGKYSVRFTMIGFQDLVMSNVRVQVDLTTRLDGALAEKVIGMDEVVVQASRPMIQTDVTYSQANISSDEVAMLPVEEFEDVIALQAGVVTANGEIHVRGGRGGEIAYMIDGITVTDPFNSDIAVEIENNAIQELQFISGTFNAEYGQAMSGIVNIITKDGSFMDYLGSVSVNGGNYYSDDTDIFPMLDRIDLQGISDLKANIEGPILPGSLSFFASGRIKRDNGHLYGRRVFHPNTFIWDADLNNFVVDSLVGLGDDRILLPGDTLVTVIDSLMDKDVFDWVLMNWHEQKTMQAKLSWRIGAYLKISYNRMFSDTRQQSYSHLYKWNPDGRSRSFGTRTADLLRMDLSISQSTFANIMLSRAVNHYRSQLSNDPDFYDELDFQFPDEQSWNDEGPVLDSAVYYVDPRIFDYTPVYNYYVGGQSMDVYTVSYTHLTLPTKA